MKEKKYYANIKPCSFSLFYVYSNFNVNFVLVETMDKFNI